jgi:hypothetical protein
MYRFAQEEQQLLLREVRIDERQRDTVECEIPRSEPRELPLVRHRQDVGVVEVRPPDVAAGLAFVRRLGLGEVAA